MRLGVWLETWFERGRIEWARSTQQHRAAILDKWIAPYLSGVRLRDLGEARIRALAPGHPRRRLLAAAVQPGAARPVGRAGRRRRRRPPSLEPVPAGQTPDRCRSPARGCMTPDQIERLRAAMPSQRDRVLLGLLAYAGLRPEEALALRWIDVGRLLVIDRAFTHGEEKGTKTNQRRTVEIIKPLAADLEALRAASGGEGLVGPVGDRRPPPPRQLAQSGLDPRLRAGRRGGDALRLPPFLRVAADPRGALAAGRRGGPRPRLRRDDLEALRPRIRGGAARVIDADRGRDPRRPLANRGPGPVARKLHGGGFEALRPLASEAGKAASCREKAEHARQDSNLRPLAPEASALSTELRALGGLG